MITSVAGATNAGRVYIRFTMKGTSRSSARYVRRRSPPIADPPRPLRTMFLIPREENGIRAALPIFTASRTCPGNPLRRSYMPAGSTDRISSIVIVRRLLLFVERDFRYLVLDDGRQVVPDFLLR